MYHVLLVDHYDSFTDTLRAYLIALGCRVTLRQYDHVRFTGLPAHLTHIILSPGPGHPAAVPQTQRLIRRFAGQYPLLGVCLGHQCIASVYGGTVLVDAAPTHGKTAAVYHHQTGLFSGLPSPFRAMRYHSLRVCARTLPPVLVMSAWTQSSICMALTHKTQPIWGIQFHPESVLSEHGHAILSRFLAIKCA